MSDKRDKRRKRPAREVFRTSVSVTPHCDKLVSELQDLIGLPSRSAVFEQAVRELATSHGVKIEE